MEQIAQWLVDAVQGLGYPGLFILIFMGNVFVPIPLEVLMIPAGYLVNQGQMHVVTLLIVTIFGDIAGSLFSYYLALHFGRRVLYRFGKYVFFTPEHMEKLDRFFKNHGEISVLTGRLVPGLRHFMAFPAGLAHMQVKKFMLYTGVGGGLWLATLVLVGYIIGGEKTLVRHYMPYITGTVVGAVLVLIVVYVLNHRRKAKEKPDGLAG